MEGGGAPYCISASLVMERGCCTSCPVLSDSICYAKAMFSKHGNCCIKTNADADNAISCWEKFRRLKKNNLLWISRGQSKRENKFTEMENKCTEWKSWEGEGIIKTMQKLAKRSLRPANGLLMQQRTRYVRGSMLNSAFHYRKRGSLNGMSRQFSRYQSLNSALQSRGRTIYTHYLSFIKV